MKNLSKVLALVLVVAMVFSFAVSASAKTSFKDDASIKYEEAVELLSALKVINGYTDGTFKPTGSITRGEFAVMVSYMVANDWSEIPLYSDIKQLGKDYAPYCTFADTKNHWSAGYVAYCAGNGYISGRSADVFDPDATITAAEISVILLRVMGYDATIENFGTTSGTTKGYATQLTARNAGLLEGLDTMNFWAAATREQAAQLMFNALKGNVVTYGNVTFTLDLQGRVVVSNLNNTKAVPSSRDLMSYCFRGVQCIEATDNNGYTGHQWIVNLKSGANVATVKLTDVYADDTVIATYYGGTAYSKIAKDLGVAANSVRKATEVYVNGALAGGTDVIAREVTYNGKIALPVNLVEMYQSRDALPDNCRLVVVKDAARSQAATSYKLLYYYELVAQISSIEKITARNDVHYGQYMYTFDCWWKFPYDTAKYDATKAPNGGYDERYVFAATDNAYSAEAFYLVEPNESKVWQPSANIDVVEDYQDLLNIKVAKTEAPVKFISGAYKDFQYTVEQGKTASDGTKNYKLSKYAHDFIEDGANYGKNMMLIYNTAGYVQGFAPVPPKSDVVETGYFYVDSLEYSVTATQRSSLIATQKDTLSAQAKALVYRPTAAGNNVPEVIDLRIVEDWEAARYGHVDIKKIYTGVKTVDNGYPITDANVKADRIDLGYDTTNGFCDSPDRSYAHYQAGNVRVFDVTFDGWYIFTKYTDGKFSLERVHDDKVTTVRGDPNVTDLQVSGKAQPGYVLTSSTTDNVYSMDTATMTAKVTTVTGYKNIASGVHGDFDPDKDPVDDSLVAPYTGKVGGVITLNTNPRVMTIPVIDEFTVSNPGSAYRYALCKGSAGYFVGKGTGMAFLGAGAKNALFAAAKVKFVDKNNTATVLTDADNGETLLKNYLKWDGSECYALTLDASNKVVAIKAIELTKATAIGTDVDGYVRFEGDAKAYNFDVDQVWHFNDGKAETIANGDTIYYANVDKSADGSIEILWLLHKAQTPVTGVNFHELLDSRTTPWVWWIH